MSPAASHISVWPAELPPPLRAIYFFASRCARNSPYPINENGFAVAGIPFARQRAHFREPSPLHHFNGAPLDSLVKRGARRNQPNFNYAKSFQCRPPGAVHFGNSVCPRAWILRSLALVWECLEGQCAQQPSGQFLQSPVQIIRAGRALFFANARAILPSAAGISDNPSISARI